MVIPSTAKLGNIIAQNSGGDLGSWSFVDHETGLQFCNFDSFGSFSLDNSSEVAQYPLEGGSFHYYNKLDTPTDLEVTLIKSGLELPKMKQKFIRTLRQYAGQPKLVDITTPSGAYIGYTIRQMQFQNLPEECSDMLVVTLSISEIRLSTELSAAKPKASARVKDAFKQLVGI